MKLKHKVILVSEGQKDNGVWTLFNDVSSLQKNINLIINNQEKIENLCNKITKLCKEYQVIGHKDNLKRQLSIYAELKMNDSYLTFNIECESLYGELFEEFLKKTLLEIENIFEEKHIDFSFGMEKNKINFHFPENDNHYYTLNVSYKFGPKELKNILKKINFNGLNAINKDKK